MPDREEAAEEEVDPEEALELVEAVEELEEAESAEVERCGRMAAGPAPPFLCPWCPCPCPWAARPIA